MEEQKSCCEPGSNCDKCRCVKHVILAVLAIALIAYVAILTRNALRTYDYIGKAPAASEQITVSGTGKVTATPDVAEISIGTISQSATVNQATKDNTDKMNKIVDAVKNEFKIDAKDVQTSNYNVSPNYDYTDGRQRITGYTVSQSLSVKVRDFTKTGDLLGRATELGANSVSGPVFTIDNPEKFQEEARAIAIKQAKEKASVLAGQVGIKLGRIVSYSEGNNGTVIPLYAKAEMSALGSARDAAMPAPVIESGSQDIQIDVSISFELN